MQALGQLNRQQAVVGKVIEEEPPSPKSLTRPLPHWFPLHFVISETRRLQEEENAVEI